MTVAVIGAGCSGLAVLAALRAHGLPVAGFERGSDVGGLWRYDNDSGHSSAYASLRTNVSRARMQDPSFPMPRSYGDFPGHRDMADYLGAYADARGLREAIGFGVTVERLEPDPDGGRRVVLDDGSVRGFRAVVVATGVFWSPRLPGDATGFAGEVSHSHDYRTPEPFRGRRVLVVGGGQSAAEIAVEVAGVAARVCIAVRGGAHVLPRWIGGRPYDAADVDPLNRLPWPLLNLVYGRRVARELGPPPACWPPPAGRPLEGVPIVSSDLLPAVRRGEVTVKPAIQRLAGDRVRFVDGTEEPVDRIVYATGYRIDLPFLAATLPAPRGRELPCTGGSRLPGSPGCCSPASSTRPVGCCPWWRRRPSGSPPSSPAACARPRRRRCGGRSTGASGAPASGSPASIRTASAATPTPTGGCCTPTCGGRALAPGAAAHGRWHAGELASGRR
jgi:dimethylaniline monooxygenase (N-oxide forming)